MENPAAFDLDQHLDAWRNLVARAGGLSAARLDELEDHLRESFAALSRQGLVPDEAFHLAARRLGTAEGLAREYSKASPERLLAAFLRRLLLHHPRKLIFCTALGGISIAAIYLFKRPPYVSEAKLLVMERPGQDGSNPEEAATLINTEVEILTSFDLDRSIAEQLKAAHLLPPRLNAASDPSAAAMQIRSQIRAEAVPRSAIIRVTFLDSNPAMVQPALTAVLESYKKRHIEVRSGKAGVIDGFLSAETARFSTRSTLLREDVGRAEKTGASEAVVSELRREQELAEENFRYYAQQLRQTRLQNMSGPTLIISEIQQPTPPQIDWRQTIRRMIMAGTAAIGIGLLWALAAEVWLTRLRRQRSAGERMHTALA